MRRWEGFIRCRYGAGEPQGTMRRPPSHFCGLKAYVARGACFAFSRDRIHSESASDHHALTVHIDANREYHTCFVAI